MSIRIDQLRPGDRTSHHTIGEATLLVIHQPHPLHPGLALVVWWMHREQRWSIDALYPSQLLPDDMTVTTMDDDAERAANLRAVLHQQPAKPRRARR